MTCRGWFRFVNTGYICNAPGTAHRPFPTVSLEGCTSAPIVPTMWNAAKPSQSPAVTALPKGEPRLPFRYVLPLRLLFLQCGTPYRPSSTAYGGPPSPKGKVLGVVPFNRTDSIRSAPGTAHRPSPTVSLEGGTVRPHGLYSERCLAMNHRRYIA